MHLHSLSSHLYNCRQEHRSTSLWTCVQLLSMWHVLSTLSSFHSPFSPQPLYPPFTLLKAHSPLPFSNFLLLHSSVPLPSLSSLIFFLLPCIPSPFPSFPYSLFSSSANSSTISLILHYFLSLLSCIHPSLPFLSYTIPSHKFRVRQICTLWNLSSLPYSNVVLRSANSIKI